MYADKKGAIQMVNTWDEVRQEIVEKLDNPSKEDIALYIEKAYRLGYAKGIRIATDILNSIKYEFECGSIMVLEQLKGLDNELKTKGKKRRARTRS